jgi:hypothetical protein
MESLNNIYRFIVDFLIEGEKIINKFGGFYHVEEDLEPELSDV